MPLHLQTTVRQRGHPSCQTHLPLRGETSHHSSLEEVGSGEGTGHLSASDPLPCPFSRKRSPPLGGAPSPSSLSLPPSTGFPLQASRAPSPYLSSVSWGQGWEMVRCLGKGGHHLGRGAGPQGEASPAPRTSVWGWPAGIPRRGVSRGCPLLSGVGMGDRRD